MHNSLTIGTRGSQLALWQAQFVKDQLERFFPELEVHLKIIKTTGDTIQDRSLVGLGKGVFTKEIENALLAGDIDLAVHSLKDLPTELPQGLCITAIPTREDPRDVLITDSGLPLNELLNGAKIGTTSPRRKAQLLHIRPDLQVVDVRGNIDTRLRKLHETDLDGIILAAAGIKRLGISHQPSAVGDQQRGFSVNQKPLVTDSREVFRRKTDLKADGYFSQFFDVERMVPAVGQGALAIEARVADDRIEKLLAPLNDQETAAEITAERAVLENLGGGCQVPIGAYAKHVDGELSLISAVCHPEGTLRIVEKAKGELRAAQHLGEVVAEKLRESGATGLLAVQGNLQ